MNYDQAKEQSFLALWKTMECFSGPDCWCRIIVPVEPIFYNHPESPDIQHEYVIVDAGALDQEVAEYIVRLHNLYITRDTALNLTEEQKENFKKEWDKLNIRPRSIGTIEIKEMVETFKKLWETKNSKIGKIVRKEID